MIELGLVKLIQANQGAKPLAPGGWAVQLPANQITEAAPMAWTYRCINSEPSTVLEGQDAFTALEMQIDCHGFTMADAILLARAVDSAFRGFRGKLTDPHQTWVEGVFRTGPFLDGFSDANRSYVRSIEYLVNYIDQDV